MLRQVNGSIDCRDNVFPRRPSRAPERGRTHRRGPLWPVAAVGATLATLLGLGGCGNQDDTIVDIAVHPQKSTIVYITTNESVYKTRDTGATWDRLGDKISVARVLTLAVDPILSATVLAGTNGDGVYRSPDGGRRWLPSSSGMKGEGTSAIVNQFVFDPHDPQTVYAATTRGVFKSTDNGRTWEGRVSGMREINFVVSVAIDPERPWILYAGTSGGVFRSTDGAATWNKVNTGLVPPDAKMASMNLGVNALAVNPSRPEEVYAGTTRGLFKSEARGDSWTGIGKTTVDPYVSSVLIDPDDPGILYVGGRAGVLKSTDGGATWQVRNTGLESLNIRTLALGPGDPYTLYAGTNGSGLYRSADKAESWKRLPLTPREGSKATAAR